MDHGHAHPSHDSSLLSLTNNDFNRQQTPHRPLSFFGVPNTPSPLRPSPQTLFETPLTLPQKRLQLRNAGFRAPRMPSHRLSTRISRWFSEKDDSSQRQRTAARNQENSPPTVRRRTTRGSPPPSSILQEVTNSARSWYPEKSAFMPIYEDDQDTSPTHSWYHDVPSTQNSPLVFGAVHDNADEMKLREISGNAQRSPPPLSSPLARQVRGRSKRSLNLRKTSFPASEHIVFLETRLEEVEKSQYSPNTGLHMKEKIKVLTTENSRLEEMLAELEHQFETRLRESVEHKTNLEVNLRRKTKQLEEEIGWKDSTIRDLEYRNDVSQSDLSNVEAYKAAVERLESEKRGLEETNHSLEKRNDVLTDLLGHSPTRSHHGFDLPSPVRDLHKKTPRPRSMMPRLPTSPTHLVPTRPLSLHTSTSPFQPDYFSPLSALLREQDHPCDRANVDPHKVCEDSQSIDFGPGESCSVRSGNEPVSKRSSMHSFTSASPAAWGLPLPPSPTDGPMERSNRKRTRRFPSGSTQLKPLVLPTLNSTSSLPQSAPLSACYSSPFRRDISEQSMDPTISFVSRSFDTPTQLRRRSNTWAAPDALRALEGTSGDQGVSFEEILGNQDQSQPRPAPSSTIQDVRKSSNYQSDANQFSPTLVDDMIVEEDSSAFLSNQFDVGDQSFSSMVGELSVTESDIDRAHAEEQTLTTQSLGSELSPPMSLQLPSFAESRLSSEEPLSMNVAQRDHSDDEVLPEARFESTTPVERQFANPLTSTCPLPHVSFRDVDTHHPAERRPSRKETAAAESSATVFPFERPAKTQRHSTGIGLQTSEMTMPNPLKVAPPLRSRTTPQRPQSPLEVLQRRGKTTGSLTSVTNRTIFGSISHYTSYVREIRRDPTALARRVIANAWCSNWKRLGKLSWWVLGLFLGPGWTKQVKKKRGCEAYDGENIAYAEHERFNGPGPSVVGPDTTQIHPSRLPNLGQKTSARQKKVQSGDTRTRGLAQWNECEDEASIYCKSCDQRSKNSWGKSLYLWGKFSVAILLAVGGAVIKGPEEMLKECDLHHHAVSENRSEHVGHTQDSAEDHDILFDYSLDLRDEDDEDDGDVGAEEAMSPQSFQTAKSIAHPAARHERSPSVPLLAANSHYTFGAPPMNEYDCYDDNGQSRPSRSRAPVVGQRPNLRAGDMQKVRAHHAPDLGTLQWMQNLRIEDFARLQDIDDRNRTIRASPRQAGKRTYSTLS